MPQISIIVPVYNGEKYLERCINSILEQSISDFELILVDDGSDDNSGVICNKAAAKDKRVKVFHIPNGGVSCARNLGIENASGKYITFVDSDDYIETDHIRNILIKGEEELSYGGYKNVDHDKVVDFWCPMEQIVAIEEYKCNFEFCWRENPLCFVWCGCYKTDIIKNNDLKFDVNVSLGEDILFNIRYLKYCKTIRLVSKTTYFHNKVESSLVHKYYPERLKKEKLECQILEEFIESKNLKMRWYYWHIALNHFAIWSKKGDYKIRKDAKIKMRKAFKDSYFKEAILYIRKNGTLDEKIETYLMEYYSHIVFEPICKVLKAINCFIHGKILNIQYF